MLSKIIQVGFDQAYCLSVVSNGVTILDQTADTEEELLLNQIIAINKPLDEDFVITVSKFQGDLVGSVALNTAFVS